MIESIFKILTNDEWQNFEKNGIFEGSEIDKKDGFFHFSTSDQVHETIERHFQGMRPLYIVEFKALSFKEDLKWELSRNDQYFPHLYSKELNFSDMKSFEIIK